MIPFQIVMIPLYILTVQLGLKNSYLGVIFPGLASAFGIFLLRQAFLAVPKELRSRPHRRLYRIRHLVARHDSRN